MHDLIKLFGLVPHPDGGFYKETYHSKKQCSRLGRQAGSSIYYYLTGTDRTVWHRIGVDRVWYYHSGSCVRVYTIDPDGQLTTQQVGNPLRDATCLPQICLPANHWVAVERDKEETFSLLSSAYFPAFQLGDCSLGTARGLERRFPQHSELIERFTRK